MGDTINTKEHESDFEMLKALYDFNATIAQTLSFAKGDHFILHSTSNKQRNWWHVVNISGQVGYIPSNYVMAIQVTPYYLVPFLTTCMEAVKQDLSSECDTVLNRRLELLQELYERKQRAEEATKVKTAPTVIADCATTLQSRAVLPERVLTTTSTSDETGLSRPVRPRVQSIPPVQIGDAGLEKQQALQSLQETVVNHADVTSTSLKEIESSLINAESAYQLVQEVREVTQLSHDMSRQAVGFVARRLCELVPSACPQLTGLADLVCVALPPPSPAMLQLTADAGRLRTLLSELTAVRDDAQQRSWELYEDEATIADLCDQLVAILNDADTAITRHVLVADRFEGVSMLLQYYQMEVRWPIRERLLRAFSSLCALHSTVITLLLNSILPMELARDMESNPRNVSRLVNSSQLLTMIFSMGEPMPITHLDHLGGEWLRWLLGAIEDPPDTDVQEVLPDCFLLVLLAYNLQFPYGSQSNVALEALAARAQAKAFTERLLMLFNREEDPVRVLDHRPTPSHSVLKLMTDLFSLEQTAALFYTNDVKVLIDIIVRQLTDLSPGDARRSQYLELCRLVLRRSGYNEHRHRLRDLHRCLTTISGEEGSLGGDHQLVEDIIDEFPQFFKRHTSSAGQNKFPLLQRAYNVAKLEPTISFTSV